MTFRFDDENNRPKLGRRTEFNMTASKCFQQTHNVHPFTRFSEDSVGNAVNPAIVRCLNGFSIMNAHDEVLLSQLHYYRQIENKNTRIIILFTLIYKRR